MTTKRLFRDYFHFNGNAINPAFTSTLVNGGTVVMNAGEVDLNLAATNEIESARVSMGDQLAYPIGQLKEMSFWAKVTASLNAAITVSMGLASAGNAAPGSISARMFFSLNGSNSLVINTSDGTLTNTNIAVNDVLVNSWKKFTINLAEGTVTIGPPASMVGGQGGQRDVLFAVENSDFNQSVLRRVAPRTLFDTGNYSGGLQPYFQIQKTASTATGTLSIRRVEMEYML